MMTLLGVTQLMMTLLGVTQLMLTWLTVTNLQHHRSNPQPSEHSRALTWRFGHDKSVKWIFNVPSLYYWNCNFPMIMSVGQSVCHNFLKGQELKPPCSYRSTCFFYHTDLLFPSFLSLFYFLSFLFLFPLERTHTHIPPKYIINGMNSPEGFFLFCLFFRRSCQILRRNGSRLALKLKSRREILTNIDYFENINSCRWNG